MSRTLPEPAVSGSSEGRSRGRGLFGGLIAFVGVAGLALAIGLSEFAASGGAYRLWTWIKVGSLYLVSFFGVSTRMELDSRTLFQLHIPLMVGTVLAGWLLFRAGRGVVVGAEGGRVWARASGVALSFAVPVSVLGLFARLRFPDLGGPGMDATIRAISWQVVAFPALFAAAVVGLGVLSARPVRSSLGSTARLVLDGGWWACRLALVLAFAGLLLVAAIRSDRTAQYGSWLGSQGTGGALLFGHQVLAAPNQAFFVLAPAMGGATNVWSVMGGMNTTTVSLSKITHVEFLVPGVKRPIPDRQLGGLFSLFYLVPAIATVFGGRRVARGVAFVARRLLLGAGAGAVFGLLVTCGMLFASIRAPISRASPALRIQPAMPSSALFALAWGLAGGMLGALFVRQLPAGVEPGPTAEPPASPTSA